MHSKRIFIAGHNGMVGSAIARNIKKRSKHELVLKGRDELDLQDQDKLRQFLRDESITEIYLAAAKVGGIHANNTFPAEFIYSNLVIQTNVVHEAYLAGIKKILFLGSSCIYPRMSDQPMAESALLGGKLESTNEPYAIAKIAGIKLCESYNRQYGTDFRSVMPTNLYGQLDNFHPENSHVIPGLIHRMHQAKQNGLESFSIWGSGTACREFLHVDDMAEACVFVMNLDSEKLSTAVSATQSHLNIGTGNEISILELAEIIAKVIGYEGEFEFDSSKPDGAPRKLLDVSAIEALGWKHKIELKAGLEMTYQWYCKNANNIRQA